MQRELKVRMCMAHGVSTDFSLKNGIDFLLLQVYVFTKMYKSHDIIKSNMLSGLVNGEIRTAATVKSLI